jgi:truncated hemoglobin YjbI
VLANSKFEASYARLFGDNVTLAPEADEFFVAFYERFLRDDRIAERFRETDLNRLVQMLRKSLFQIVAYYLFSEETPELVRLAQVHRAAEIDSTMFDQWLEALIDTVAEFDPEFDETVGLAWCWALAPGITFMRIYMANPWRLDGVSSSGRPDT